MCWVQGLLGLFGKFITKAPQKPEGDVIDTTSTFYTVYEADFIFLSSEQNSIFTFTPSVFF